MAQQCHNGSSRAALRNSAQLVYRFSACSGV